jgi:murein DD-endopeptidase MepM/ murein hydrolase activator NlpD
MTQGFGCTPYHTGVTGPDCPDEAPWFHDGVDIANSAGVPVRAAISGTVIFAGTDSSGPACGDWYGYGLTVIVDSGQGWQTLYGHLSRIDVAVGQVLLPDSIIGAIGQTGCASGPHLHFGLNYRGVLVDPALYVPE